MFFVVAKSRQIVATADGDGEIGSRSTARVTAAVGTRSQAEVVQFFYRWRGGSALYWQWKLQCAGEEDDKINRCAEKERAERLARSKKKPMKEPVVERVQTNVNAVHAQLALCVRGIAGKRQMEQVRRLFFLTNTNGFASNFRSFIFVDRNGCLHSQWSRRS